MHRIYLKFPVNVPAMVFISKALTDVSLHRHFNMETVQDVLPTEHLRKQPAVFEDLEFWIFESIIELQHHLPKTTNNKDAIYYVS